MLRERFRTPLDPRAVALSESTTEDAVLLPYDLWGSIAHARMLGATRIVSPTAARRLEAGLRRIGDRAAAGRFPLDPALEDVHLNVETALAKALGPDGARLHTARSRNDQVALDIALYLRDALLALESACADVASSLRRAALRPSGRSVVSGWTHMQPAQAVYWGQILGTHALRFARDSERFRSVRVRLTDSPLGAGALAGSSLPIDRQMTARMLGFARPSGSSIDSVSDRDAVAETVFACVMAGLHAGALCEELVIGSMAGVERVRLHDAFVTTSSLMPHKRNPDLAELVRAESGAGVGRLAGLLAVLKGVPLGYQRDLQATKPLLVHSVERTLGVLAVLGPMAESAEYSPDPPGVGGSTASVELADALVGRGVPFREAHGRVARFLADREPLGRGLSDASAADLRTAFPELGRRGFVLPKPSKEPELRRSLGGSSRAQVGALLVEVRKMVSASRRSVQAEERRLARLRSELGIPERWRFVRRVAAGRRVR
jgi:argininosuccinate lyase